MRHLMTPKNQARARGIIEREKDQGDWNTPEPSIRSYWAQREESKRKASRKGKMRGKTKSDGGQHAEGSYHGAALASEGVDRAVRSANRHEGNGGVAGVLGGSVILGLLMWLIFGSPSGHEHVSGGDSASSVLAPLTRILSTNAKSEGISALPEPDSRGAIQLVEQVAHDLATVSNSGGSVSDQERYRSAVRATSRLDRSLSQGAQDPRQLDDAVSRINSVWKNNTLDSGQHDRLKADAQKLRALRSALR